jgi:hypothetical protein
MKRDHSRRLRLLLFALLALVMLPNVSLAQAWATKMFKVTSHDFESVARGGKAQFKFEFENVYEEDIHIAGVRSSCGCTTPSISKSTLKTWEKAHILAEFNTRSFLGQKSATVTVVIDKPSYAEVQLSVSGYIRSDVVFDPSEINLGEVDQGDGGEAKVTVNYAGRNDWHIVDVRSANKNFEVELQEARRGNGRVDYDMTVRLRPGSPAGHLQDQLTIVTDDTNLRMIPLHVQGRVTSPLTVSPATLFLGVLEPGETVKKQLVVRAKQPFRVLNVSCDDDCFEFKEPDDTQRKLHFISVIYTADETGGKVSMPIRIETDLASGAATVCQASATIRDR